MNGVSVVLLVRAACPLCDAAREHLRRLAVPFREEDVETDASVAARYGERVPVVLRDGVVIAEGDIDPSALRRGLTDGTL